MHMHKHLLISLCLLLAFSILQVHNFIPHQHRNSQAIQHSHHHGMDHHNHDADKNNEKDDDHQSPITELTHNADFGKVITKKHFEKKIIEKSAFPTSELLQQNHSLLSFTSTKQPHPPDNNISLHLIFLSHCLPLRAPPAFSCLS